MFVLFRKGVSHHYYQIIGQSLFFSNLDKSMERIVFKHLYNHFLVNETLTPLQSGFIPGDSTVKQLTFLYDTFKM